MSVIKSLWEIFLIVIKIDFTRGKVECGVRATNSLRPLALKMKGIPAINKKQAGDLHFT